MKKISKRWSYPLLIILPVCVIILFAFYYYKLEIKRNNIEKYKYLEAVNNLKMDQILQWRNDRIITAKFFPTIGKFIKYTVELSADNKNSEAEKYFLKTLLPFKVNHYYNHFFLTDTEGRLLYSLNADYNDIDSLTLSNIKNSINNDSIFFSDFIFNKKNNKIYFDLFSPVKDNYGHMIGVIVQRIDPAYNLYSIIQKWPSSSKTAETLLARKEEKRMLFLTNLKYKSNPDLSFSVSLKDTEVVAVKGANGMHGMIEGEDYRGTNVLADLRIIPGFNWYIISKIDKDEIHSEVISREIIVLIILIISVLCIALILLFLNKLKQSRIYKNKFLTEKRFLEAQKEFKTILYSIGDGVITTDAAGDVKRMNEVAEKLTGWSESEAQGKNLSEVFRIINEESRQIVENPVQKVIKGEKLVSIANHTLLVSKNGEEVPIADSGAPIKDNFNKVTGVVLVFRDQSKEREKEKILIESEERLRLSLASANQGLYDLNIQTGEVIVNDEYALMLGYDPKNFIETSSSWNERLHPDDKGPTSKAFNSYVVGKTNKYAVEFRLKTRDNKWKWILSTGKIVEHDGQGKPLRLLGTHTDITQRKIAEEELKESELLFRTLAEHSTVGIFRTDVSGNIDYVNPKWCEISCLTFEQGIGNSWLNAVHPEDRDSLEQDWKKTVFEKIPSNAEFRFLHPDGSITWVIGNVVPLKDENNSAIGFIGTITDITESKRVEEELRKSAELLRASVEISNIGIFDHDQINNTIYWSPRQREIHGWGPDEPVTLQFFVDLIHPEDRKRIEESVYAAHNPKGNGLWEVEHRIIRRDGEIRWLAEKSQTFFEGKGDKRRPVRTVGVALDITQRKLIERNLRSLSRAVEQSPAAIVITDLKGCIEFVNPKFTEMTGYTLEEVKGKNPNILKSDYSTKEQYEIMWNIIADKKEWRGELLNKKKNGDLFWVSAYISPIVSERGDIINYIALEEDITDRKKMIRELTNAKEKAEEMNRMKSHFFANMSHELRTPFVGIMGFAELLAETSKNPEEKEYATKILKSSYRLTETLNKILEISRLETTIPELKYTDFDLNDLLNEIAGLFVPLAKNNGTEIIIKTEFNDFKFYSDKKLLREIISNLINNAVKFTYKGSIEITSRKIIADKNEYVEIKVSDTGIGIPKDRQSIIWQEFRQASEGIERSFEGTGLGLTITKKYVELLDGRIQLESEEGKGSVFTLKFPIMAVSSEKNKNKFENPEFLKSKKESPMSGAKVLIVEDDGISLEFMRRVLQTTYSVDTAINAKNALELIQKNKYDVLLLDINLGRGMNGIDLVNEIKKIKHYENVPTVAVTAYASEDDKSEFLSKGFTHYISKPFLSDELKKLLIEIMKK